MLNIVLVEPEIPPNTGNVARTCALTNSRLHLVKPLGFSIDDKSLKRAGLDYWHLLEIYTYDNFASFLEINKNGRFFCATTKAKDYYTDFKYEDEDFFIFGSETKGLNENILQSEGLNSIKVPMIKTIKRSLNLSNSVNIILFEALRQLDFQGLN